MGSEMCIRDREMIESFASAVDSATLEEKRRLLRTIVKKVV